MATYPNRIVKNRKSPENEDEFISAYKKLNKNACKSDNMDIAAVKTKDGTLGHVLLPADINRSKDSAYHIGKGFITDSELKKNMNN